MKAQNNYITIGLCIICVVCLSSAYLVPAFPWLVTIALAPLFDLYRRCKADGRPFIAFGIPVVISLVLVFSIVSLFSPGISPGLPLSINFGIIMSFAFFAYWLTDTFAANRLGFITVVLFYTGFEYLSLVLVPGYSQYLLGSTLEGFPGIQRWNGQMGITAVSAWLILTNIATYHIFLRDSALLKGILRWRSLLLSIILLSLPALISVWFFQDSDAITTGQVKEQFSGVLVNGNFAEAGEVLGRTTAWVSVLVILYGLVRSKVNK